MAAAEHEADENLAQQEALDSKAPAEEIAEEKAAAGKLAWAAERMAAEAEAADTMAAAEQTTSARLMQEQATAAEATAEAEIATDEQSAADLVRDDIDIDFAAVPVPDEVVPLHGTLGAALGQLDEEASWISSSPRSVHTFDTVSNYSQLTIPGQPSRGDRWTSSKSGQA